MGFGSSYLGGLGQNDRLLCPQWFSTIGGTNGWGPWKLKPCSATRSREELAHSKCQWLPHWETPNPTVPEVLSALFLSSSQAEHWKHPEWCWTVTVSVSVQSVCISHLALNAVLLGVKSDPVVLGQDTRAMAAPIQSFTAVGVPCCKHRRIPRLFRCRSGAGPGCFGWLWIVLHVLLSLKGRRGFIVATGLASRAWTAVSVHCPAAGHCHLCWEGVTVGAGAVCISSRCRLSQARPEALMRQKGIRAGIKIPGESEFLDSLVWLKFLFDSQVLLNQSPTRKLLCV